MTPWIPEEYVVVVGCAEGHTPLNAFDAALADAGVQNVNLIKVSSIIPAGARRVARLDLVAGAMVPAAYATKTSNVPGTIVSAAVGIARTTVDFGIVMEFAHEGSQAEAERIVSQMLAEAIELRGFTVDETDIAGCQVKVQELACCFAGVVFSPVPVGRNQDM